ncbi:hypothetical protein Tco_1250501 [Tanacetum coccineum]
MAKSAKRSRKPETTVHHSSPSPSNPKRAKQGETVVPAVNEAEVAGNVVENDEDENVRFVGKAVPSDEARVKWPHRYETKARVKRIPLFSASFTAGTTVSSFLARFGLDLDRRMVRHWSPRFLETVWLVSRFLLELN